MEEMCRSMYMGKGRSSWSLDVPFVPNLYVFTNLKALQTQSFGFYGSVITQAQMTQSLTTGYGLSPSPFCGSQEGGTESSNPLITWLALCVCASHSVMSDSLWPHGHELLCLWDLPGKNTGMGRHSLLQGIFPTRDRTHIFCIAGRFFTASAIREAQWVLYCHVKIATN